jgi:hypothetical protein
MHGMTGKGNYVSDFVIMLEPFMIVLAQPGFQSSRSFGFLYRQKPILVGAA